MKIETNRVVSIHYTLTNDAGDTIDSSAGRDPLTYLHGNNALISGLEKQLEGHEAGASMKVSVQPEDGYGPVQPQLLQEVPLSALAGIEGLAVGMRLQAQSQDGGTQQLVVRSIGEESAVLDANHELAGQVLHFDVTVESVREASAEELSHGHPH